jgi:RNA recognition motif-containing protein
MLTINVRGLPRQTNERSLTELFAAHGRVHGLRIAKDLFSGECKGFAELQMEGHEARAAITALNGAAHGGELLRVELKSAARVRRR